MTQALMQIKGGCHCGNIRFVLQWPDSDAGIAVRNCSCTFCQKHAGAWTSHRGSALVAQVEEISAVSKYRFGTRSADFYVCATCGIVPFVTSEIDDQLYAVVNVNSFEDVSDLTFTKSSTDFDGEKIGSRLERRKRNWISSVRISTAVPG